MENMKKINIFGDSILKGIQINPENKKYYVGSTSLDMLSEKYSIQIKNYSSFGCTVTKGSSLVKKILDKNTACDAIIMDYGGNDCDYNWKEISEHPENDHLPNTPIKLFVETYSRIIDTLKKKGIMPILATLPPLEPQRFFEWFCKDLNKANIMKWLGGINKIFYHQESYSKEIEKLAFEKQVSIIDFRGAFLKQGDVGRLLCEDGTHPNTLGQEIITSSLCDFADKFLK